MTLSWRAIALAAVLGMAAVGGAYVIFAPTSVPDDVLAERIQYATPRWTDYDEDVKGQIGAGPVAEWRGRPVRAEAAPGGLVRVTFSLEGPWAGRKAAMPVLLRDPYGNVRHANAAGNEQGEVSYSFAPAAPAQDPPGWIEVRYPRGTRRIVFDSNGQWDASGRD